VTCTLIAWPPQALFGTLLPALLLHVPVLVGARGASSNCDLRAALPSIVY